MYTQVINHAWQGKQSRQIWEKGGKSIRIIPWCIALSRSFILLFFTFILHHRIILKVFWWVIFFCLLVFTVKKLKGSMNYHTSPIRLPSAQVAVKTQAVRHESGKKALNPTDPRTIIYIANVNKSEGKWQVPIQNKGNIQLKSCHIVHGWSRMQLILTASSDEG